MILLYTKMFSFFKTVFIKIFKTHFGNLFFFFVKLAYDLCRFSKPLHIHMEGNIFK